MSTIWKSMSRNVPDHVRTELVDMCFATRVPLAIAGVTLALVASHMAVRSSNAALHALAMAGLALTAFRIGCEVVYRRTKRARPLSMREVATWERVYAVGSFAFAGLIGILGAVAFRGTEPPHQLLATAVVFGYAAGIVCRISVRPLIALPALMIVAVPTAISAAARVEGDFAFYAAILMAFLLGSFETVRFLYWQSVDQITLKHQFAALARNDALTGLANRLGFQERLAAVAAKARLRGDLVAIHSVDLDRFKAVNDRHGHPAGDALLKAVAGRLKGILRDGDFAVRMGGDEFVVVQSAVADCEDARLLGARIIRTVSEPFAIGDVMLEIGASVGIAMGRPGDDVQALVPAADEALYASKSGGRNRVTFAGPRFAQDMAMAG